MKLEDISPNNALLVKSIEKLETIPKEKLKILWTSWEQCVVGEAYGYNQDYKKKCKECKRISEGFCDIAYMAWKKRFVHTPKSKRWKEYTLEIYNLVHGNSFYMDHPDGYTYDNTGLNKIKNNFINHWREHDNT